ncbi:MAG: ABC transporter substrate-binding protein [Pseudobdellovibrio sp.]
MESVNLVLTGKPLKFSLSVMDSDYLDNLVILEQLVGTLVKQSNTGILQPFLASRWEVSNDEMTWKFSLRNGLLAEDGSQITAKSYVKNLKKLLRIYSQLYSPPTFNQLKGWSDFVSGKYDAIGISYQDNTIIFEFETRPSGLLEFLSMPYYGFYVEDDFIGDKWKNTSKITSTGAYRLEKYEDFFVKLEAREDFFSYKKNMPKNVNIFFDSVDNILSSDYEHFLISVRNKKQYVSDKAVQFKGTPTALVAISLSPYIEPFNNIENRRAFRKMIRKYMNDHLSSEVNLSYHFYPILKQYRLSDDYVKSMINYNNDKVLKVFSTKSESEHSTYSIKMIENLLKELNIKYKFETAEDLGNQWRDKETSNKYFPIRIVNVDIGGAPENWVIDMMFCSDLGVSFPDLDGGICNIVKEYKAGKLLDTNRYNEMFHQIIEDQAIVIPVYQLGYEWLVSKSIMRTSMSQTMNIPRFDEIEVDK